MPDVYLFGNEPNAADVRLREAGAQPASYEVHVAVTATATPTVSRALVGARSFEVTATPLAEAAALFVPGGVVPPPPPAPVVGRGGPFVRPLPVPVTRKVRVVVEARCRVQVTLVVDHIGRRQLEDELLLVGVL